MSSNTASASTASASAASALPICTPIQRRILGCLRVFLGEQAAPLYDAHGRSLQRLAAFCRDSSLPGCQELSTGLALAQALLAEAMSSAPVFDSPAAVTDFLKLHFAGQAYESFVVVFLDARHQLIVVEDVFRGTLTQTSVYPREVLKRALHHNAAAVILAHNHPSGSTDPSRADEVLTETLRSTLSLIDVRVLDHLVVAGTRSMSFAERGLL
ncbi:MAG: DNA repair protein RadC [Comamonadaceae bacterium]|nr:MAG: DNA repair protein RadC [Comamonadaceae bacterium]